METLDGFITNLFRNEKPIIQEKDFNDPEVWVCDLLNDSIDLANKYILHRLNKAERKIDKIQFLYDCRSCFKYALENDSIKNPKRKNAYKKALGLVESGIKHYDECEKLNNCIEDDVEFLIGRYSQSYSYNNFQITKKGETRRYSPNRYLNCLLENSYKEVDKVSDFNTKIHILNKALFRLKRLINEFKLEDCEEAINDCNLTIEFEKEQAKFPIDEITRIAFEYKLSNRRGAKIDIIRILNALYELKFIEKKDGLIPSKEDFMKQSGNFFGADLSNYENDLSQALNSTKLESNLKIFDEMKSIIQKGHYLSN